MSKTKLLQLAGICLFLTSGCLPKNVPSTKIENMKYVKEAEVVKEDEQTRGSLWNSSESGYIFFDHNYWQIGDILTVIISERANASKSANTRTSRTTSLGGGVSGFLSPNTLNNVFGPNPTNLLGMDYTNSHDGEGTTNRQETLEARIGVIVKKILKGGNLYVKGNRYVTVNDEKQIIEISGIVRTRDIQRNNTVLSSFLANASIKYYGEGAISDRQKPGWFTRIMDWLRII